MTSLERNAAKAYYAYNRSLNTNLGSDAIILSPKVEVFKDENGELLEQRFVVAVMTCAAPMIAFGKEGLSDEQYKELFYKALKELDYNTIEQKRKDNLELADVIPEIADGLCHGRQMSEYSPYRDPDWERKYIYAQWKPSASK